MTMQDTANNQPNTALVDIRDISVDQSLPREERVAEFLRQI